MVSYGLPDITGANPAFYRQNIPCLVYRVGMKYVFKGGPVFESSIQIKTADGTGIPLVKDTDWTVQDDDFDTSAMSDAYLMDPEFEGSLIKSITFTSTTFLQRRIVLNYQSWLNNLPNLVGGDGTPVEFNPDNLSYIYSMLSGLAQQVGNVSNVVAPSSSPPVVLPLDINGTNSSNVVTGEAHTVNTLTGIRVIRPRRGAFFRDSVTITANGVPLVPDVDYIPIQLSSLTKTTTNTSGIYRCLLITQELAGDVEIGYHGVGGDVQPDDISSLYDLQAAIANYLSNGNFVTPSSIPSTPSYQSQNARILQLENDMRILRSGSPNYSDATAGNVVVRSIGAPNSNFHWYNIASLYKVVGSDDIILNDQFKCRVFLPGTKISLSFTLDVNLESTTKKTSFKTDGLIIDPLYSLFTSVSASAPVYPLVRLVYNYVSGVYSGAYIQVGLPIPALLDQLVVEDLSTQESCWILDKSSKIDSGVITTTASPADTGFTLPDGVSMWAASTAGSYSEVFVPRYEDGYLVYGGAGVNLSDINTTNDTSNLFNMKLPTYFPIANIKSILLTMTSDQGGYVYNVEIPMLGTTSTDIAGRGLLTASTGEMMSVSVGMHQTLSGVSTISLGVPDVSLSLLSGLPNSLTDNIRYIRAKV